MTQGRVAIHDVRSLSGRPVAGLASGYPKHAGSQATGWHFTMRQLYDKSGSAARFSDFAIDVRKVVKANDLPEYTLDLHTNEEGEEVLSMLRRSKLQLVDPNFEVPRHARRRIAGGITQKAIKFN